MSLQSSTFNTAHVLDNEIIKAADFEFAFEKLIENVAKSTQMILESNQDFVINGKVLPYQGMNVQVSPIYGVCKSTGIPFGRTETATMEYGFEETTSGRVDIIEVQGDWETFDNQQRAFNDPDTDTQTYQYVDTKKLMRPVYRIKQGEEGTSVAPEVDEGWVKLAEVSIRANASTILESDIHNITADISGLANEDWTTETTATYNIGYISDVNARFRAAHNEDGSHKNDAINTDSLNIGIGTKQVNANVLPIGGNITIPTQAIAATDSILSVLVKSCAMITSFYNAYLKFGNYNFKGELSISALADENNILVKPLKFSATGDGTATIKIDNTAILSIDANGKLSTNGFVASSPNHIITKSVTDAISAALAALTLRVEHIENTSDVSVYANGTLSTGTGGRYNIDNTSIYAATTENITLSGSQTIDGISPVDGVFILVKNQTNEKENGLYQYSSNSVWSRVSTFASPNSIRNKIFQVNNGTQNGGRMFFMPKVNFIDAENFGSDNINFLEFMGTVSVVGNRLVVRDTNGNIKASTFIGNLTGTATEATHAASATSAASATNANYATSAGSADAANYANQLQAFTGDDFSGGNHFIKAIRDPNGWPMRLWTCYNGGAKQSNDISVHYADSAGSASSAGSATSATSATHAAGLLINGVTWDSVWTWSGQSGQPSWLWGSNDGTNMYVWNPSNFSVAYAASAGNATSANSATSAGNADTLDGYHAGGSAGQLVPVSQQGWDSNGGYIVYANGLLIQWGLVSAPSSGHKTNVTFPISYFNIPAISINTRGVSNSDYGESRLGQVIGTTSGFSCDTNVGQTDKTRLYWMAIGY